MPKKERGKNGKETKKCLFMKKSFGIFPGNGELVAKIFLYLGRNTQY